MGEEEEGKRKRKKRKKKRRGKGRRRGRRGRDKKMMSRLIFICIIFLIFKILHRPLEKKRYYTLL